jgi:hypothetical protein
MIFNKIKITTNYPFPKCKSLSLFGITNSPSVAARPPLDDIARAASKLVIPDTKNDHYKSAENSTNLQ